MKEYYVIPKEWIVSLDISPVVQYYRGMAILSKLRLESKCYGQYNPSNFIVVNKDEPYVEEIEKFIEKQKLKSNKGEQYKLFTEFLEKGNSLEQCESCGNIILNDTECESCTL